MAALPYMQLYVADYLADTVHLDVIESGAYLHLLMNYWQTGKPLIDNNKRLSKIAKCTEEQWLCVRITIEEFFILEDGFWFHKRVEKDLEKVKSKSIKASISAKKRWEKTSIKTTSSCERIANEEKTQCHTEADTEADTEKQCAEKSISQLRIPYKKIISYLNKKAGSEFSYTTLATKRFIKARWNEGHREKDFFSVIENKCSEWRTNPNMILYLRPQTLFGTKFESYLQQKKNKTQQNRCGQCIYNQRDPCKNLNKKSFDPIKCTSFSPT